MPFSADVVFWVFYGNKVLDVIAIAAGKCRARCLVATNKLVGPGNLDQNCDSTLFDDNYSLGNVGLHLEPLWLPSGNTSRG